MSDKIRPVDFAKISQKLRNSVVSQLRRIGSAKFCDMRNKFLFLLESTDLLKIAGYAWLLQLKLKIFLSSDIFCYVMENYPLAVLNLHKLLPAKYLYKEEKVPFLRFRKVSRFRGG